MPDEPSKMIRVPTPLIDAVRQLSRLHRAGRTKAVLEGVEKLVAAIDSEADVDIDSVTELISGLTERLNKLEAQQVDSTTDIDIASGVEAISGLTERLEKVESDIEAIALSIQDLSVRMSDLEEEPPDQTNISSDSDIEPTAPPTPLTQSALAKRLDCSDKAVQSTACRVRKALPSGPAIAIQMTSPGLGKELGAGAATSLCAAGLG